MLKKFIISLSGLLLVLVLACLGYLFWASNGAPASQQAIAALKGTDSVQVTQDPWISFIPAGDQPGTGIIFYPGGQADPRSYAPTMLALAEQGNLAVIVPMPFNLAVMGIGRAADVMVAYPQVKHWIIAGHSLGGVMAAQFVSDHPGSVDGLAFWAAYSAADLDTLDIPVSVIYGSADAMATVEEINEAKNLLPANTDYHLIEGADHYQFGYFDEVPVNASISREQQQQDLLQAMQVLIERVKAQ